MFSKQSVIGVVGSGAMGSGIAQVAATAGHRVIITDASRDALKRSESNLQAILQRLAEKQKITTEQLREILSRITFAPELNDFNDCHLVIEAVVENPEIKKDLFRRLELIVSAGCVLATNTSSLSITSIGSALQKPGRFIGIHFFNPAPLMPLVEIIPGIATNRDIAEHSSALVTGWGKTAVVAKDTPGFIVNRVARPFYSESIRIADESIADMASIDWALRTLGGFKMGPFELMDLIGHDVNYIVTETVWREMYFDPRFRPSVTQKRLLDAGFLGKKSGRGFYNYGEGTAVPAPREDRDLGEKIFLRVLSMLVNEAADAVYLGIASREHVDLAMTRGVNYPKGLLAWGNEIGPEKIVKELDRLREFYQEERYRVSPLLRKCAQEGRQL